MNEMEPQAVQEDHHQIQVQRQLNQPHIPVRGNIVSCYNNVTKEWYTIKVKEKVQGYKHYFNVYREDGQPNMGMWFKPSTAKVIQMWSILEPEEWNPPDNLLRLKDPDPPSRQITPETSPTQRVQEDELDLAAEESLVQEELPIHNLERDHYTDGGRLTLSNPNSHLEPDGACFPSSLLEQLQLNPSFPTEPMSEIDQIMYTRRVVEVASDMNFPQHQEHLRLGVAQFIVSAERRTRENSITAKVRKFFKRK